MTTRQISASQTRRRRNLVLAALGLTLAGFAWFGMAWAMLRLQAARCPVDAFFWASNQSATALQVIPLALPALGIGFLIASLCQFCLGPQGVAYQAAPCSGFRQYIWEDVASVTATCHYRRGRYSGWTKQLIVTMRDGASLDLMTWPAATARAYPEIVEALRGREFSFDAKGVAPLCPEPYLGILTRHP